MKAVFYIFVLALGIVIVSGVVTYTGNRSESPQSTKSQETPSANFEESLSPVNSFEHSHGLALDPNDSSRLYIATHDGLFVLLNDKDLYAIGEAEDDYMGFSAHPTEANVFFTSGHPKIGGNLGVQESTDGGVTWTKISNGEDGPVDFHAMTISPANPEVMFGWYKERLQRSTDGGITWEWVDTDLSYTMLLVAHPTDENILYAMTFSGPFMSRDQGETWQSLVESESVLQMLSLAVDPQNPNRMISYSNTWGLAMSEEEGSSWTSLEEDLGGESVLFFAIASKDSNTIYALTNQNRLYKTMDGGSEWNQIL